MSTLFELDGKNMEARVLGNLKVNGGGIYR